ncbi:hypothetical protein [Nocardia terpenica]|nr:hypothetical protein [Nocardia terpenica]
MSAVIVRDAAAADEAELAGINRRAWSPLTGYVDDILMARAL